MNFAFKVPAIRNSLVAIFAVMAFLGCSGKNAHHSQSNLNSSELQAAESAEQGQSQKTLTYDWTALRTAITNNDIVYLKEHIAQGLPLRNGDEGRAPLLYHANTKEMVVFLLENGADPSELGFTGANVLGMKCEFGRDLEMIQILLEQNIPLVSEMGASALAKCFKNLHFPYKATKLLIEHGALGINNEQLIEPLTARTFCVHYTYVALISKYKPGLKDQLLEAILLVYSKYGQANREEFIRLLTEACEYYHRTAFVVQEQIDYGYELIDFLKMQE